jgi:transcriptional regulator with XRE-family HTH domain
MKGDEFMNLSDNLKKIRKEHNLSQEDLAEKLGVSRQSVSKWESNQAYPEMDKVIQLCKMFNLNMDELLNQDINETKDREIRKKSFNKQVDSFLNFITKTVNMFSSMRFRDIIKCLFEQVLLILIALFVFFIYATIVSHILNVIDIIPFKIRDFMEMILHICYLCVAVVVLLHIFKIRYLDYYRIVDKEDIDKELDSEIKEDKKENIVIKKQTEKIIIRDPEKSSAGFFNLLARIIVIMFKAFIALLVLPFIASFVGIVVLIVLSFLFVKTGALFIGCLLGGIGALLLTSLVIVISYNYIFNGAFKWNRYLYEFLLSLILGGVGIGLIFIGIKSFNILDYNNEKYYSRETQNIDLKNNLTINYYNAQFVETNSKEIKVELIKPKYSQSELYYDAGSKSIYVRYDDYDFMKTVRFVIDLINDKYVFDDIDVRVLIYANKENIEKIKIKR